MSNYKLLKIWFYIVFGIISISCNEDFDAQGEFKEVYSLYCVLDGDSEIQIATLNKNYKTESLNPFDNSVDPTVKGAKLILTVDGKEYKFRDTVLSDELNKYNENITFYYIKSLKTNRAKTYYIKAYLPNGDSLMGNTTTPKSIYFNFSSRNVIAENNLDRYILAWTENKSNVLFVPKMFINYLEENDGNIIAKKVEVPHSYIQNNDIFSPNYPKTTSNNQQSFNINAFEKTLELIPKNENSSYTIKNAEAELLIMNADFGTYYSSVNTYDDGFSIKSQPPDYSNINGGSGILGYFSKVNRSIKFEPTFINRLVLKYGFNYSPN